MRSFLVPIGHQEVAQYKLSYSTLLKSIIIVLCTYPTVAIDLFAVVASFPFSARSLKGDDKRVISSGHKVTLGQPLP
jgi:hypothetical protein